MGLETKPGQLVDNLEQMKEPPCLRHIITVVSYTDIIELNQHHSLCAKQRKTNSRDCFRLSVERSLRQSSELELDMQIRHPVLDIPLCQTRNRLSSLQEECNNHEENKKQPTRV